MDATRRAAGALLPRFDFTRPVLSALGQTPLRSVTPATSAFRGVLELIKGRRDSLLIRDEDGRFAGLLTERDFLKLPLETGKVRRTKVSELMTPATSLSTAPSEFTMLQCVEQMRDANVRHLPIVEDEQVKAVIGLNDVARHMSETLNRRSGIDEDVTVGDLLAASAWSTPQQANRGLPLSASVETALERMRETHVHALLVTGEDVDFGIFTERDYVHNVLPYLWYEEQTPADVPLSRVARWAQSDRGASRRLLQSIAADPALSTYRPEHVTCVEQATPVRDCLALMLGNGLLYVPVLDELEHGTPSDIIALRDITLFLARDTDGE